MATTILILILFIAREDLAWWVAVLGDFNFTAFTGKTITSNEELVNPYDRALTIEGQGGDGFLTTREVSNQPVAISLMNM